MGAKATSTFDSGATPVGASASSLYARWFTITFGCVCRSRRATAFVNFSAALEKLIIGGYAPGELLTLKRRVPSMLRQPGVVQVAGASFIQTVTIEISGLRSRNSP